MNYLYYDEELEYPSDQGAYGPDYNYPEYMFGPESCQKKNKVYDAIRKTMYDLGFDKEHYGSKEWNPLGVYVKPGMNVLIKPNFVMHKNGSSNPDDLECLVTHPSIIRCVIDYCLIALKGRGNIWVADSPVKDCDFHALMERGHFDTVESFYANNNVAPLPVFCDLRGEGEEGGNYKSCGSGIHVNLGEKSYFYAADHDYTRYRIPNYDYRNVCRHHSGKTNEYMINSLVLEAEVIISLPKPKTHRKNGYTGALKNFIGVNYSKEYLPHHRSGGISEGGDEYKVSNEYRKEQSELRDQLDIIRTRIDQMSRDGKDDCLLEELREERAKGWRRYSELSKKDSFMADEMRYSDDEKSREGSWHGNDTLWRTILDINLVVKYFDSQGIFHDNPQRKILYLGDMIIAGEGEGPLAPTPKNENVLLFSDNAVSFDLILLAIMGFDSKKFVGLKTASTDERLTDGISNDTYLLSNNTDLNGRLDELQLCKYFLPFEAPMGWRGYT